MGAGTFATGQLVTVAPDRFDASPAWRGEIVGYWRNGAWIVRELAHGTTCAYNAARLAPACEQRSTSIAPR